MLTQIPMFEPLVFSNTMNELGTFIFVF